MIKPHRILFAFCAHIDCDVNSFRYMESLACEIYSDCATVVSYYFCNVLFAYAKQSQTLNIF